MESTGPRSAEVDLLDTRRSSSHDSTSLWNAPSKSSLSISLSNLIFASVILLLKSVISTVLSGATFRYKSVTNSLRTSTSPARETTVRLDASRLFSTFVFAANSSAYFSPAIVRDTARSVLRDFSCWRASSSSRRSCISLRSKLFSDTLLIASWICRSSIASDSAVDAPMPFEVWRWNSFSLSFSLIVLFNSSHTEVNFSFCDSISLRPAVTWLRSSFRAASSASLLLTTASSTPCDLCAIANSSVNSTILASKEAVSLSLSVPLWPVSTEVSDPIKMVWSELILDTAAASVSASTAAPEISSIAAVRRAITAQSASRFFEAINIACSLVSSLAVVISLDIESFSFRRKDSTKDLSSSSSSLFDSPNPSSAAMFCASKLSSSP